MYWGEVIKNTKMKEDVHVLKIRFDGIENFSYLPGQFAMLSPNGTSRAYSIANAPNYKYLEFCIRKVPAGKVSPVLCSLKEGETLKIFVPFGEFTLPEKIEKDLVFICTGTGIAPIKAMIEHVLNEKIHKKVNVTLVKGALRMEDVLYPELLKEWSKKINVQITNDLFGYIRYNASSIRSSTVFVCGSPKIVLGVMEECEKIGCKDVRYEKCILNQNAIKVSQLSPKEN